MGIEHIPELAQRAEQAAMMIPFAREQMHDGSLSYIAVRLSSGMPQICLA